MDIFSHKWVRQFEIKTSSNDNFQISPLKKFKVVNEEKERNSTLFESVVKQIKESNKRRNNNTNNKIKGKKSFNFVKSII